jgi:hypothetical protein
MPACSMPVVLRPLVVVNGTSHAAGLGTTCCFSTCMQGSNVVMQWVNASASTGITSMAGRAASECILHVCGERQASSAAPLNKGYASTAVDQAMVSLLPGKLLQLERVRNGPSPACELGSSVCAAAPGR